MERRNFDTVCVSGWKEGIVCWGVIYSNFCNWQMRRKVVDKVAEKLAALLVREKLVSESMLEIYQYGLVRMLEIGAAVFSGFVICLSMGMIKEGLLFLYSLCRCGPIWVGFI